MVATPIGNLGELSSRAADALRGADLILAEDTRVTRKLLSHLDIHVPLRSNHRHNEREQAAALARRIAQEDMTVALVSDAGTPGISDPGAVLVAEAATLGIPVMPVAGPSAVAAALSVCGFEGRGYSFYGFPPRAQGERNAFLMQAAQGEPVAVLYESPHRVKGLIESIEAVLPKARLCLCCDLTKKFELTLRGSPCDVLAALMANPNSEKGEYVLVIDLSACRISTPEQETFSVRAGMLEDLLDGLSMKEAVSRAIERGASRNDAYRASLEIKKWIGQQTKT